MLCLCIYSPAAISAQGMKTIWHRKTSAVKERGRNPQLLPLMLPRKILYFPPSSFCYLKRLGIDCALTMEPSLRARSPIPHIHSDDRAHPSVLSLHVARESLGSHCSALSVEARGHAGVEAEEKNCLQLAMSMKPGNRKRAGGGDRAQVIDRTGAGCCWGFWVHWK